MRTCSRWHRSPASQLRPLVGRVAVSDSILKTWKNDKFWSYFDLNPHFQIDMSSPKSTVEAFFLWPFGLRQDVELSGKKLERWGFCSGSQLVSEEKRPGMVHLEEQLVPVTNKPLGGRWRGELVSEADELGDPRYVTTDFLERLRTWNCGFHRWLPMVCLGYLKKQAHCFVACPPYCFVLDPVTYNSQKTPVAFCFPIGGPRKSHQLKRQGRKWTRRQFRNEQRQVGSKMMLRQRVGMIGLNGPVHIPCRFSHVGVEVM